MGTNTLLRARVKELGLTQDELAERLNDALIHTTGRRGNFTDRSVRNLLNGTTRRPTSRTCLALQAVFGCPVERLGFEPPCSVAPLEEFVRRRTFIGSTSGAAMSSALPLAGAPKRVGRSDIARLEEKFSLIIEQDHRHGGRRSIEMRASALAGEALSLLQRGSISQRVRHSVYACAASFTSSALWAAIDGRRFDEAQRHFERASSLASMSGDTAIQFRIWSHAGSLYRHLGRPIDALTANDVARKLPDTRRDPMFASLGHARHAAVLGLTGDRTAVCRSVEQAQLALERADTQEARPTWLTAFFGQCEIESLALTAHLSLQRFEEAEAHAHRTLALLKPGMDRSQAIATARLAHAQLGQGDLEPAVTTALHADAQYPRVAHMLEHFDRKLHRLAPRSGAGRTWNARPQARRDAE